MARLILHNDKENSYLKIKASLIKYCNHEGIQAEQCTIIAHNNGKVVIKEGDFMDLLKIRDNFERHNINVELTE